MMLLQIGDRVINIEAITHASYDSQQEPKALAVSFGFDDYQAFYGAEADIAWSFITSHAYQLLPEGTHLKAFRIANK